MALVENVGRLVSEAEMGHVYEPRALIGIPGCVCVRPLPLPAGASFQDHGPSIPLFPPGFVYYPNKTSRFVEPNVCSHNFHAQSE